MTAIDLNAKQKNVLHIINKYPAAANDEMLLLERYWYEIDGYNPDKSLYDNLSRMTRPGTITRRKRELREMGLIQYSEERQKETEEAFINERDKASSHKAVSWLD